MKLVRAPLRISFVGGGSDVPAHSDNYGGAVVSATINKYIYITTKDPSPLFPHKYRLVYSKVETVNKIKEIEHPILKTIMSTLGPKGLDLDVMSDVPAGTGLGSSSAFTVGLCKAAYGNNFTKHMLAEEACEIEIDKLKEPIGKQDQYAAAFGGLNLFEFSLQETRISPILLNTSKFEDSLHLLYIGGTRNASTLLKEQFKKPKTSVLRKLTDLALLADQELRRGYIDSLGYIIYEGWVYKKELSPNVSNSNIDAIIETAMRNGATGGKLLGAGEAGFILLFCPPKDKDKMLQSLLKFQFTYVPFNFEYEGAKLLYGDD